MEAVIVTDADAGTGLRGGLLNGPKLGGVEGAGLFDQDVFAGLDGGETVVTDGQLSLRQGSRVDVKTRPGTGA